MTNDQLPPIDWHNPIPGNTLALQGEIDRIRQLRDRFRDAAGSLRDLGTSGWTGEAAGRFESFVPKLIQLWEGAEDEHERWASALANYRETLLTLQPRAKDAVVQAHQDGDRARAETEINRWRLQVHAQARHTAAILRDVSLRLWSMPLLLPEQDTVAQVIPVAAVGPLLPEPRTPGDNQVAVPAEPDPVRAALAKDKDEVRALCDAILDAEFVSAEVC